MNLPSPSPAAAAFLLRYFEPSIASAAKKDFVADLTAKEACAICLHAGVPYETDSATGKIRFQSCGLYKRDGKWTALI